MIVLAGFSAWSAEALLSQRSNAAINITQMDSIVVMGAVFFMGVSFLIFYSCSSFLFLLEMMLLVPEVLSDIFLSIPACVLDN